MSQFLWGAFGAFAVEFIRLWRIREGKIVRPATYFVLSLGMVLIAGVWAFAVAKNDVPLAQITSGASAPAAISMLASSVGSSRRQGILDATNVKPGQVDGGPPDASTMVLATDRPPPSWSTGDEVLEFFRALGR